MARPVAARDARTPEGKTVIQAADRSSCESSGEPAIPRHRRQLRCATDSDNARTRRSRSACDGGQYSRNPTHLGASQSALGRLDLLPGRTEGYRGNVTVHVGAGFPCCCMAFDFAFKTAPSKGAAPRQHVSACQPGEHAAPVAIPQNDVQYIWTYSVHTVVWCRPLSDSGFGRLLLADQRCLVKGAVGFKT